MASGNLCNAGRGGIGAPELRAHKVQSSQPYILARTHAQEFCAAVSQSSFWYVNCRAKLGQARRFVKIHPQRVFKTRHDIRVLLPYDRSLACAGNCQTFDESENKLLLDRSCSLLMSEYFRLCLHEMTCLGMEAPQSHCHAWWRSQDLTDRPVGQIKLRQRPAVISKFVSGK